ncbi:hypothetical protein Tco_0594699 [Tanacetum coccineum]
MVFHKMDTKEVSDRFVAPCFVNGLEAYDREINLGVQENMILSEYAVKQCLEHEVKRGNKIVKKELIVALRGEIYFVKFIINPEEDDVEPGVIFKRSFLRMTKAITDFGAGTIIIYPDIDPFLEDTEEEEKSMDDWDQLLGFNLDDIPLLGREELSPFVCKIGKSSHNKKRAMENLNLFYQDIGTSLSTGRHLTQEEAAKEALALRISQKFALLEEVRLILETMAYHDKYKKVLDEIWKDKVELDGMIVKEEENEIKRLSYGSNSSLGNICLGENIVEISSDKIEGSEDWDSPEYQDTAKQLAGKRKQKLGYFTKDRYQRNTKEEEKNIDDWDQLLDFNLDDIPLLGGEELPPFVCKMRKSSRNKKQAMENLNLFYQDIGTSSSTGRHLTQEEAAKEALALRISQKFALLEEVKGEALKEKDDPEAFIFPIRLEGQVNENALANTGSDINTMPYRIYEQLEKEEINKVDRGITMINHTQAEGTGILTNVLCQTMRGNDAEAESSRSKRSRQFETVEEVLLPQVHHEFLLWEDCNNEAKSRYNTKLANLLPRHVYSSCVVNWDVLNGMECDGEIDDMLRIRLREAESNEEIFTYVACIRAFNIKEPIYTELCDEFYSTYEFYEVCDDDELQSKKIIKFRLGRRAHNLTLLEFSRRLGLYHGDELEEGGFDVYFQGGLRSDDNFNAQ